MDHPYKKVLKNQQYEFIGEHTAVKICGYTKKAIKGEESCYKQKFYGIKSHRCIQMSPAINSCNLDCVFCWRERNNWNPGVIDDPIEMVDKLKDAQNKLLTGFGGNEETIRERFEESKDPWHVAISLNGETFQYPKLNEFIKELKKRNMSSFVVTNGMFPDEIAEMELPTQLYISVSAPNEELFEKIDRPLLKNGWSKLMKSVDVMNSLKGKTRTTIRLSLVKGLSLLNPEEYAKILEKANPDFVEAKGYAWIGASRERLQQANVPQHEEIREFAKEICKHCTYKIIDEQESSKVVLLMKEDFPGRIMSFS